MKKIIVHAGFPKCASSSIQKALSLNEEFLKKSRVAVLGNEFTFGENRRGFPLWYLESLRKNGASISDCLKKILDSEGASEFDEFVLSSENLSEDGFAELFLGIDEAFNVLVVFYFRPQFDWLTSAWKQFEISRGKELEVFINQALKSGYPRFEKQILFWKNFFPKADFHIRPLEKKYLIGEAPEQDFFSILGSGSAFRKPVGTVNASCDYSILHMLMRNSQLFGGIKRTDRTFNKIDKKLPDSYKKTNINLIGNELKEKISCHFEAENKRIVKEHLGHVEDFDGAYNDIFGWQPSDSLSYMDLEEVEVERRARSILQGTLGNESEFDIKTLLESLLK